MSTHIDTINVIEMTNESCIRIHSFIYSEEGIKEAQNLFRTLANENEFTIDEIYRGLNNNPHILQKNNGDYQLFLIFNEREI